MIITSTDIISLCSKLAALSTNQANLATGDFLNFANLSLMTLASEILSAREEYLIFEDSVAVTAGTASYRIPYRALNGIVRHLWFEDGTGSRYRLWPRSIEQVEDYMATSEGTPDAFYVMGNSIVLMPTPNINGNLIMAYPFRPNLLVDATTTTQVTQVTTTSTTFTLTLNNLPAAIESGRLFDVIDGQSGNGIIGYDLVPLNIFAGNPNSIEFSGQLPNAAVGDYLALAGQSPVPMLPEEGHPLLLEQTVMRVEMVRGNTARIRNSAALIQDARRAWDALLNNRIISKAHPTGGGNVFLPSGARPW